MRKVIIPHKPEVEGSSPSLDTIAFPRKHDNKSYFSELCQTSKKLQYCQYRQDIVNFFRTLFAHFLTVVFNVYSSMEYTLKITEMFSSIPTKGGRR